MQSHNIILIARFIILGAICSQNAFATGIDAAQSAVPGNVAHVTTMEPDTSPSDIFERLLLKQAKIKESELDAKLSTNQQIAKQASGVQAEEKPKNAVPLPNAIQELKHNEPTLEAIWGIKGKEVAEVNYKGKRVPISMQTPYVSKIDGWLLEEIKDFEITLVQKKGKKIVKRKVIPLSWQGNIGGAPVYFNID